MTIKTAKRKWINWLIAPGIWALVCVFSAFALGVELNWRVIALVLISAIASDVVDAFSEGRPLTGPRRWEP